MNPWTPKEYEERIVDQEPDFYWDSEYENYQAVFEEVVFPFSLELHDDRPGLMARVESALPPQDGYREENDRFTLLKRGERFECSQTEKQGLVGSNSRYRKEN
ncbi:hypothetical protein [Haloferax sp. Q22]|uniref:hypothetical protein n=1 Tax=Haloferax sp. (strain Q22) TaxID=1526048 RepID=UPI000737B183|nr:hypothetical protein [Haloferax sp. Q22]